MPKAIIQSAYYDDKVRAYRLSKFVLGAGVLFALVAGFTPIGLAAYASVVLASLTIGLGLRWSAMTPQSRARSFLYIAGAAAAIALTAALLFAVTPSIGLILGITALMAVSAVVSSRFLKKKHSGLLRLPLLTKTGYALAGLALAGLAAAFCLMAAGVLPTFILLPVFIGTGVLTSIGVGLVTSCTPASGPKAWDEATVKSSFGSAHSTPGVSDARVLGGSSALPGYQLVAANEAGGILPPKIHVAR